jgi:large subunit ribosomal protein L26e
MRKAHFSATSVERRVRMSAGLSKDLFQKFNVCQLFLCLFSSHSCFFFFFYLY